MIEGISLLLLLGIAMPLKYWAGMPEAVKVVGWAHGVLVIAFCLLLPYTMWVARWPIWKGLVLFIATLIPFGPFLIDGRLKD
jgi:integral membrane protein